MSAGACCAGCACTLYPHGGVKQFVLPKRDNFYNFNVAAATVLTEDFRAAQGSCVLVQMASFDSLNNNDLWRSITPLLVSFLPAVVKDADPFAGHVFACALPWLFDGCPIRIRMPYEVVGLRIENLNTGGTDDFDLLIWVAEDSVTPPIR